MYKVFDTFLYYDEDLMLDLRLNILDKYIDYFVIIESNYDFNGNFKGFNFDIKKFYKFKNKIIYRKLDLRNQIHLIKNNGWYVHNTSRNEIMKHLKSANNEDFIIHSDIDEIPNLQNINFSKLENKIYVFEQKIFYFKFNLQDTSHLWSKAKMCKRKLIKSFSNLRWLKGKKYNFYRIDILFKRNHSLIVDIIKDGGWHFTYIKPLEDIQKKLKSVVEKEHVNYSLDYIKSQINKNINFLHRDLTKLKKKDISSDFPEYLFRNKEKYIDFLA